MMWVLKKGFEDYCRLSGADANKIIDELHVAKPNETGSVQRIVPQPRIRKVLGSGTEFAKAQSWCFTVDMSHPEVTGAVDLKVITVNGARKTPVDDKELG